MCINDDDDDHDYDTDLVACPHLQLENNGNRL